MICIKVNVYLLLWILTPLPLSFQTDLFFDRRFEKNALVEEFLHYILQILRKNPNYEAYCT